MCGTATTGSSGEACNTVTPTGPCVVETLGAGTAPTPAGGTFVAGSFDLISTTLYGVPDAGTDAGLIVDPTPTREVSVVFGSGMPFSVENVVASGAASMHSSGLLSTDGTTKLTFTPTCPGSGTPGQIDYTVETTSSGTTITTFSYDSGAGGMKVKVYKKR
jgi:hypothetical protein